MRLTLHKEAIKRIRPNLVMLVPLVLLISCTKERPSSGNVGNPEGRSNSDDLKAEVDQLRESNKELIAKNEKLSMTLESLKGLTVAHEARLELLSNQASTQSNNIITLAQYVDGQQASISNLAWSVTLLDMQTSGNGEAVFDATGSTGYSRINTDNGFFLVALKNVEPYLDGYKISLDVGNPLSATYSNPKFHVSWGRKYNPADTSNGTNAYQAWLGSLSSKDITIPDELKAATWNQVQIVLAPAKSDELRYVSVKLSTDIAILRKPAEK